MSATRDLYWFAATAQVAYADLDKMTGDQYVMRLAKDVQGGDIFSVEQAKSFAAEWKVMRKRGQIYF